MVAAERSFATEPLRDGTANLNEPIWTPSPFGDFIRGSFTGSNPRSIVDGVMVARAGVATFETDPGGPPFISNRSGNWNYDRTDGRFITDARFTFQLNTSASNYLRNNYLWTLLTTIDFSMGVRRVLVTDPWTVWVNNVNQGGVVPQNTEADVVLTFTNTDVHVVVTVAMTTIVDVVIPTTAGVRPEEIDINTGGTKSRSFSPGGGSPATGFAYGSVNQIAYTLTPYIVTTSLPNGDAGYEYTATAQADADPGTWSVASGTLPPGLTLNPATGEITGTPTTGGDFTLGLAFTEGATDLTHNREFSISIFAEPPPPPPAPSTGGGRRGNCDELGCGETTVTGYNRCGNQAVCPIDHTTQIDYSRIMDDTSELVVTVTKPGNGEESCCDCLGDLRTWIHTLAAERDGEPVWGPGPIWDILERRDTFVITARDISAWLDKRKLHNTHVFDNQPVLVIAETLIRDALSVDDPCGILDAMIIIPPTGEPTRITKTYEGNTQFVGELLRELARTVLDFTVIGMSLILAESLEFGPFGTLTDDDFLVDLEVQERGAEAATDWTINGDGVDGHAGGIDPFYGLLEEVIDEDTVTDQTQADAAAANRLKASNPAPLYLNVPDDARLAPTTPICMERLVPGAMLSVALVNYCRQVTQNMRLTAMTVKNSGTDDEAVGITLSPLGINLGDAAEPLQPNVGA